MGSDIAHELSFAHEETKLAHEDHEDLNPSGIKKVQECGFLGFKVQECGLFRVWGLGFRVQECSFKS